LARHDILGPELLLPFKGGIDAGLALRFSLVFDVHFIGLFAAPFARFNPSWVNFQKPRGDVPSISTSDPECPRAVFSTATLPRPADRSYDRASYTILIGGSPGPAETACANHVPDPRLASLRPAALLTQGRLA
jgi:hypothetical protein